LIRFCALTLDFVKKIKDYFFYKPNNIRISLNFVKKIRLKIYFLSN